MTAAAEVNALGQRTVGTATGTANWREKDRHRERKRSDPGGTGAEPSGERRIATLDRFALLAMTAASRTKRKTPELSLRDQDFNRTGYYQARVM